jgi:hypothetical protein
MRLALDSAEASAEDLVGRIRGRKWLGLAIFAAAIVITSSAIYLAHAWPFSERNVIENLENATSSKVQFRTFKRVFFPHPGCMAEGVILLRGTGPQNETKMTVEKLTIEGTIIGLFTKHLALIRAEKASVTFPAFGTGPRWQPTQSKIVVDELRVNEASVDFIRHNPKQPRVRFVIHEFVAHHLAAHDPMRFDVRVQNPTPPGEVRANGSFGPWKIDRVGATPIEGTYSFRDADLGVFGGIHGRLASDGRFQGTLDNIAVQGATTTPDFEVKGSSHKIGLQTEFRAGVDPSNGDVALEQVHALVLRTMVISRGSIARRPNAPAKTASLDLAVHSGRIQDLLLLFVSERESPLHGVVSLKAKTTIPPGNKPFLQKLQMTGDFGIESALFTKEKTQEDLDKLSAAGRGQGDPPEDPENVVSDLQGHVVVKDGTATFTDLSFNVPGAKARLHGTFNLINHIVDLHGTLFMDAKLHQATSGIKSFLLKAVDPFLKKNRRGGAVIPVSITGTYQHPSYKADPI